MQYIEFLNGSCTHLIPFLPFLPFSLLVSTLHNSAAFHLHARLPSCSSPPLVLPSVHPIDPVHHPFESFCCTRSIPSTIPSAVSTSTGLDLAPEATHFAPFPRRFPNTDDESAGNAEQMHVRRGLRGRRGRRTRGGTRWTGRSKNGRKGRRSKLAARRRPSSFPSTSVEERYSARGKRQQLRSTERIEETERILEGKDIEMQRATNASAGKEKSHHVVLPKEVEGAMATVSHYLDMMEASKGNGPTVEERMCEEQEKAVEDADHVEGQPPQIGEDQEDAGGDSELDAVLWEFVGEAVLLLHEIYRAKAREGNAVPPWNVFIRQVKAMVKDKKRAAKLCIDEDNYEELLDGTSPLPARDLKRVRSFPFLFKVPSQNKRNTPPRIVPCMQDWVRALSLVDEENHHAGNPLALYRSMQRKGFAVPGFELCKLWIDMCQKCRDNAKQGTENDPLYKDYSMKELVRSFRGGARTL
eukprot:scaffold2657_cov368-Pavlova_lutheri.AAC.12